MDREKLARLEIEETELDAIEDALEEKQNDLETRMDTAESNGNMERKKQLELELAEVLELLEQVKEEKKAAAAEPKEKPAEKAKVRGAVPTSLDEKEGRTVPTAVDGMEELADNVAGKLENVKNIFSSKKQEHEKEAKEKAKEKEREAEDKKHDAKLKEKAEKIRKKAAEEEAEKAKEEKEALKKAEKEAKEKAEEEAPTEKLSEYEKLLNDGITAYGTKKYKEAYEKLFQVANEGKRAKLDEDKLGQAEQLLARMYKNGEGVKADLERAWFWFEKAAEHENIEGCLAMGQHYADMTPKSPEEEESFRENALKYFKIAGNKDSKVGKEKFIDICIRKKNQIGFGDARKACKFLDDLIELEKDSFLKKNLEEKKKELYDRESDKKEKKKRNNNKLYTGPRDLLAIVGAAFVSFGVMLFSNFVFEYQDIFLNFSKMIPEYFKVNEPPYIWATEILQEFDAFGQAYGSNPGHWAMIFIPVGFMLSALSKAEKRGSLANLICEISLYFSAVAGAAIYYYYYVCLQPYSLVEFHGVMMAVVILLMIQVARIPGMIIRYFIDR